MTDQQTSAVVAEQDEALEEWRSGGKTVLVRWRNDDFCVVQVSRGFGPRQLENWLQEHASQLCFPSSALQVNPVLMHSYGSAYAITLVGVARDAQLLNQYHVILTAQCIVKGAPPKEFFRLPGARDGNSTGRSAEESSISQVQVLKTIPSNTAGHLSLVQIENDGPRLLFRQFQIHLRDAGYPVIGTGRDAISFRGEKLTLSFTRFQLVKNRAVLVSVHAAPSPRLEVILSREEHYWSERHGSTAANDDAMQQQQQQPTLPAEYATGYAKFDGLAIAVQQQVVMIPRPGSLTLVERAEQLYQSIIGANPSTVKPNILDLGTGSGCLLLSLLNRFENATGVGIDISEPALEIARSNAKRLGVEQRCQFCVGSFSNPGVKETFDIFVCNPPYHKKGGRNVLEAAVVAYEPSQALFVHEDEADYVVYYRQALEGIRQHLPQENQRVVVVFEVFRYNVSSVSKLCEEAGLTNISVGKDQKQCIRSIEGLWSLSRARCNPT